MNKYEFLEYINTRPGGSNWPSQNNLEIFLNNEFESVTELTEFRVQMSTLYRLSDSLPLVYAIEDGTQTHRSLFVATDPTDPDDKHYIYGGEFIQTSGLAALNQITAGVSGLERYVIKDLVTFLMGMGETYIFNEICPNVTGWEFGGATFNATATDLFEFLTAPVIDILSAQGVDTFGLSTALNQIGLRITNGFGHTAAEWAELGFDYWKGVINSVIVDFFDEVTATDAWVLFTAKTENQFGYDAVSNGDILNAFMQAKTPYDLFKLFFVSDIWNNILENLTLENLDQTDKFYQADDMHITRSDGTVTADGNWLQVKRSVSYNSDDVRKWLDCVYRQVETPWLDNNFNFIDKEAKEYDASYSRNLSGSYNDFYKNDNFTTFGAQNLTAYARAIDPAYMDEDGEYNQHALFSLFRSTTTPTNLPYNTTVENDMAGGVETANYKIFKGFVYTTAQFSDLDSTTTDTDPTHYMRAVDNWTELKSGAEYTCFYPLTAAAIANDTAPSFSATFPGLTNADTLRQYQKIARCYPNTDVLSEVYSKIPFVIVSQYEDSRQQTAPMPIAFNSGLKYYTTNNLKPQAAPYGIITKFTRTQTPGNVDGLTSGEINQIGAYQQTRQNFSIVQYQIPFLQSVAAEIVPRLFDLTSKKFQDGEAAQGYANIGAQLDLITNLTYVRKFVNVSTLPSIPNVGNPYSVKDSEIENFVVRFYDGPDMLKSEVVEKADTATHYSISDPDRDFIGWEDETTGNSFNFSTPIFRDYNLQAVWGSGQNYVVKFDSNGGTNCPDQEIPEGDFVNSPVSLNIPYVFDGWYLNGVLYDFTTPVTSNFTLVARWRSEPSNPDQTPEAPNVDPGTPGSTTWPTSPGTSPTPTPPTAPQQDVIIDPTPTKLLCGGGVYVGSNFDPFYSWMWSTNVIDMVKQNIFGSPLDGVLGFHYIPFNVNEMSAAFATRDIACGYLVSDVSSRKLIDAAGQFWELSWGSVSVSTDWYDYRLQGNNAKAQIYLPYVGFVDISLDDIMNATVSLGARLDIISGSVTYCVYIDKLSIDWPALKDMNGTNPAYTFTGNCAYSLPVTAGSMSSIIGGLSGIATGAVGGFIAGGGPVGALVGGGAGALAMATTQKSTTSNKGSYSGNTGITSPQTPYLVIEYGHPVDVGSQNSVMGWPCFDRVLLNNLTGYVKILEVDLDGLPCTKEESEQIEDFLKTGVYI